MDFDFRQDIAAPLAAVRAAVTDYPAFERQALRRGAEVRRVTPATGPGPAWEANFQFRDRDHHLALAVTEERADGLRLSGDSQGMAFAVVITLAEAAPAQTRLDLRLTLLPKTLAAKLLVQSMKLARGKIAQRLEKRLETFARDIEARARR